MTFHPSDSCLQALGRDDPCYLSVVTSRAFWISTECCRVLLWSLHTSYFFLKKSQMSPSFVWGLLLLLFVAPIHNHIESDCAQYSAYSQKRDRAVTVQKSPQSLKGAAHLLCAKGVWSLVFWHAMRIWHVRLPVLGLARYTLSLQGGLLPHCVVDRRLHPLLASCSGCS